MKTFAIILLTVLSCSLMAVEQLNVEICTAFAKEYSGEFQEYSYERREDITVFYDYGAVYDYCIGNIKPMKVDVSWSDDDYYEFEFALCHGVYQYVTMGYNFKNKTVEELGGSGQLSRCPYLDN